MDYLSTNTCPVSLTDLSPDTSRFPTSFPTDIPSKGDTSVPTYSHMDPTNDLTSTFPCAFL